MVRILAALALGALASIAVAEKAPSRLERLLQRIESAGQDEPLPAELAMLFGFSREMPSRFLEHYSGPLNRGCRVIFNEMDGKKKPVCLMFWRYVEDRRTLNTDSTAYRVELDGKLSAVHRTVGKINADGQPIEGSGRDTELSPRSRDVKRSFDQELQFWLKQADKPASNTGPAAQPLAGSK